MADRLTLVDERLAMPVFGDPVSSWHWWFEWKPVRTFDQRIVWLRWICRRCIQTHVHLPGPGGFWWQYALPSAALKERT